MYHGTFRKKLHYFRYLMIRVDIESKPLIEKRVLEYDNNGDDDDISESEI